MPLASSGELTSKPSAVLAFHSTQTRSLCAFYLLKHVSRNVSFKMSMVCNKDSLSLHKWRLCCTWFAYGWLLTVVH